MQTITYGRLLPDISRGLIDRLGMLQVAVQSWNPWSWPCLNIRHAGPSRERVWEPSFLSVFGVFVAPLTDAEPFEFQPFRQTDGRNPAAGPEPAAQTQHRPPRASCCSFMSTMPSMNHRIFPNISPAPYPPSAWNPSPVALPFGLTGSILPASDHSSLHVPAPGPLENAPVCLQSLMTSSFSFTKSRKVHCKWRDLRGFQEATPALSSCRHDSSV